MEFKQHLRRAFPILAAVLVQACGGGGDGGGSNPPAPTPAPTNLTYPAHSAYTMGTAIAALSPTVNGSVTSYSITPTLPAGLQMNAGTGSVTGTPTALQPATNYQVTAANGSGSVTTTLSITVNDVPPDISYPAGARTFTTGVPVALAATATGGAITAWSIAPALPAGLAFNTTTGAIGGTPTTVTAAHDYVVSAQNSGGSDTFTLNITVQTGVLLDLGHADYLNDMARNDTRMLTQDDGHRAVLWRTDALQPSMLAHVETCSPRCIALAGPTAAFQTTAGFELHASTDGALLSQIPAVDGAWVLASDGSYVCAWGATALSCWNTQGTLLFTRPGDYRFGQAVASVDTLRIAKGAAGNNVIEKIAVPSGASTLTPAFATSFVGWFADGQRFLATAGNSVAVYSNDAVSQETVVLPTVQGLGGTGSWYWTQTSSLLRIYAVGGGGTAAASYAVTNDAFLRTGTNVLGVIDRNSHNFSIVDLAGGSPSKVDHVAPAEDISAFSAANANDWAIGNTKGAVFGQRNATQQIYGRGAVRSIAGTPTRCAISTASGRVLVFNSQTLGLEYEFIADSAAKLELSDDGTRLVEGPDGPDLDPPSDRSVRLYDLPGQTLFKQWTYDTGGPQTASNVTLSGSGLVIGQVAGPVGSLQQKVTLIDDTPIFSQASTGEPIRLTPDAGRIAIPTMGPTYGTGTQVFVNGSLTTTAAGWAVDWLDDTRLLLNRYHLPDPQLVDFDGAMIIDSAGNVLATPALPELRRLQRLSATSIYSPELNLILEIATGTTLWSSATESRRHGAVAGNRVLFDAGATVRAEPRP